MPTVTGVSFGLIEVICSVDDTETKKEFRVSIENALSSGFVPAGPMVILVVGETDSRENPDRKAPMMYYAFPVIQAQMAPITVATPGMRVQ